MTYSCYVCHGKGVIKTATWYDSDPPEWAYGDRRCHRCYGTGYV